jgi:hypothetical protein
MYKPGGGFGSQRTYLCINPYRSMSKNPLYRSQMQSLSNDETDQALLELEENYINATGKNKIMPK